jgi:hypothetical protein
LVWVVSCMFLNAVLQLSNDTCELHTVTAKRVRKAHPKLLHVQLSDFAFMSFQDCDDGGEARISIVDSILSLGAPLIRACLIPAFA